MTQDCMMLYHAAAPLQSELMTVSEAIGKDKPGNIETISQTLVDMVSESNIRLTPKALEKKLRQQFSVPRHVFKTAVNHLIADGRLTYTYRFGCSFLETSFNRPVRISDKITLTPPEMFFRPPPGEIVVKLRHGASFGTGDHPTTRLAARGIEHFLSTRKFFPEDKDLRILDIGTGSGILAIIAVLFGAKKAVGIDIDPCAISEAKKNVTLNHLENQIEITGQTPEQINTEFSIIIANLRYPTLKRLSYMIAEKTEQGGIVVISGVRTDEIPNLLKVYGRRHFRCAWEKTEKGWAGLVLVRS